ncbi:MAG TPA: NYN domain-containing protein [Isosphaeraceae bacterium]|nr:NYN domain-containing protein [Isosphaeraceae bacterium]
MRYLIDGYNLMHALGLLPPKLPPGGLRKARTRFLNTLAEKLGPTDSYLTTVVFDAQKAPAHLPSETRHKGLSVEYAADVGEADERIEQIIARHSAPRTLCVVSTDLRIRQAARRRRASAITSDDFWSDLEDRRLRTQGPDPEPRPSDSRPDPTLDREHWLREFGAADDLLKADPSADSTRFAPTDEEIARIAREIEKEKGF